MIKKTVAITQENFDRLLNWLDSNREISAEKYEKIRIRLIRIFAGRGCFEAEELADETINRVMVKLPQIADGYLGEPALYFYGVANNIYHEWLRRQKKLQSVQMPDFELTADDGTKNQMNDLDYECLENCLALLPFAQHELIVQYYQSEKGNKIDNRRRLAEELGVSTNALQIKTSRIRSGLKKCVQNCLDEKG